MVSAELKSWVVFGLLVICVSLMSHIPSHCVDTHLSLASMEILAVRVKEGLLDTRGRSVRESYI
jgi:hypothetical protein